MKNRILKAINYVVGIIAVLAICLLDSESWIPLNVLFGCLAWFGLFIYANKDYLDFWEKEYEE